MTILAADVESTVRQVIKKLADGHRHEDVDAYLALFDPAAVWVTSRGACSRGRAALGDYLDKSSPAG